MKKGYWPSIAPPHDRYVLLARLLPEVARAGMVVSPDRLIRLQRLLETLSPDLPVQELGPWLSPLFATNDLQQDHFARAMDAILQSLAEAAPKVAPKAEVDQPTGTKATDRPLPKMPEAEREAEKPAERSAAYTVDIEQCTEPPYVWRIAADEDVPIAEGSEQGRTLARLRSREASDLRFLDWSTTLRATIAQAGMPALRYRARTRTVEYLLLVERFSADDHRALLFDHLYQNLRSQDVLIERYFHDGDPRHCYNERHPNGISLRELHYRHVHARLLYMGNGYRLLDHETGQPADWAKNTLLGWNTRMLLTPLARHGWGLREFQLKSLFILLPAAWEALRYAAEYPQPDQALRYTELPDYVRAAAEWPQAPIDAPYLPYLRAQLPKPLLLWTAACAVWPALHFNLTLQLGRLLSDDTYNLLQYHHLARLAALPWFANGFIPKDVRKELLEYLDTEHPDTLRRCADYLLQLLQQQIPDNPRSHAAAEHTLHVAMLQTLAAPQPDEVSLSRLRTVLKRLRRPAQITDFVLPRRWEALIEETGFGEEVVPPPQPDDESPLRAGIIFAENYRLEALIGQGGFGQVWQVTQIEPIKEEITKGSFESAESPVYPRGGWLMAIKIFTGGERDYDYCIQEFKQTNRLEHSHIIRLYDCGIWNGLPWQTMPLHRPVAAAGQWEEDELWRLLRDMADALAYLHAHKPPISHNDIKPGQFLQDQDGAYLLADFGISGELLQVAARDIRPTVNPEFLPPECSSDLYYRSLATDVYALGASLYYLATGRPPAPGRSSMTSQSAAPTGPAPLPTQFSGDLNYLLVQCLSDVPAERPTAEKIRQVAGDRLAEGGLTTDKVGIILENLENEVVAARVTAIKDGDVVLDIGYILDGLIPLSEFRDMPGIQVGDKVDVYVEQQEDARGRLTLSRRKAKLLRAWERIVDSYTNGTIITGTVISKTKGGLIVDCGGLETFLPGSQIDIKPIIDYDIYVGKTMEFKVVKINETIKNAVVSHKALIESDLAEQRQAIIASLERGQVLEGIVKNITDFGAFLDLGGVDGLLYITDISWGLINHPSEVVQLNQKINVVVLDVDENKKRISLGLKQLLPHPWEVLDAAVAEGSVVKGRVVNIEDYGAFLEIQPGVEGLVHVSEVSWSNQPVNAREYFRLGEDCEARVVTIDRDDRKMSLSIKQLTQDPWSEIADRFPINSTHQGEVKNLTPYGVFVELAPGIGGMVHISDLSWTKRYAHPSEFTKVGEKINIMVLDIDRDNRKLSLGHKQTEDISWETFEDVFPVGSYYETTVLRRDDSGANVHLPYGLEGFVPIEYMRKEDGTLLNIKEKALVKIIEINRKKKQILVSLPRYVDEIGKENDSNSLDANKSPLLTLPQLLQLAKQKRMNWENFFLITAIHGAGVSEVEARENYDKYIKELYDNELYRKHNNDPAEIAHFIESSFKGITPLLKPKWLNLLYLFYYDYGFLFIYENGESPVRTNPPEFSFSHFGPKIAHALKKAFPDVWTTQKDIWTYERWMQGEDEENFHRSYYSLGEMTFVEPEMPQEELDKIEKAKKDAAQAHINHHFDALKKELDIWIKDYKSPLDAFQSELKSLLNILAGEKDSGDLNSYLRYIASLFNLKAVHKENPGLKKSYEDWSVKNEDWLAQRVMPRHIGKIDQEFLEPYIFSIDKYKKHMEDSIRDYKGIEDASLDQLELEGLKQSAELLTKRINLIRVEKAIETDPSTLFKYNMDIERLEAERAVIIEKINVIQSRSDVEKN